MPFFFFIYKKTKAPTENLSTGAFVLIEAPAITRHQCLCLFGLVALLFMYVF